MDLERALLSRIVKDGSLPTVLNRAVESRNFISQPVGTEPGTASVWDWMVDHYRRYTSVPSEDLFRRRWPGFVLLETQDPLDALLNEFIKVIKRREGIEKIRELSTIVDDPEKQPDLEIYFMEAASELARLVPTTSVHRYSDSFDRLEAYKKREQTGFAPGISTLVQEIDDLTYGVQAHETMVIEGFLNIGKAQPLYSKILTPDGWRTMGELEVGDEVVASSGASQEVTAVFPRGRRSVYRVTFTDGTTTECCAEHLWSLKNLGDRKMGKGWRAIELQDVMEDLRYPSGQLKWIAPMPEPVEYRDRDLPLDPYVLGALLGDGGLTGGSPMLTSADPEIVELIEERLEPGHQIVAQAGSSYGYRIRAGARGGDVATRTVNRVTKALNDLGLMGLGSHQKFIPGDYMVGDVRQRLELLQGLCDTDGSVLGGGYGAEFCSTSRRLAEQVVELVRSLGGRASIKERSSGYRKDGQLVQCRQSFRVFLSLAPGLNPFRLTRKARLHRGRSKDHVRTLKSVELVGATETQCIMVSSSDHLYVTDDFILTHNSSMGVGMAAKSYFERGQTILFLTLEMEGEKLSNRWDAYAAGISYSAMKRGELNDSDKDKWMRIAERAAESRFEKDIIVIDDLYHPSIDRVHSEVERWQPDFVVVDPIDEISAPSQYRTLYERQGFAIREIKTMSRVMRRPFIVMAQAGRDAEDEGAKLGNIAGSIDIARKADIVVALHASDEMQKMGKMKFTLAKNRDDPGKGFSIEYKVDVGKMLWRKWKPEDAMPVQGGIQQQPANIQA